MAVTTITFSELDTWLKVQPENTVDTPYELEITELNKTTLGTLGYILKQNSTKYVDLSNTVIPSDVISMSSTFSGCTSLVNAPTIPDGVIYMSNTFSGCESLVNAPAIPKSVEIMSYTFSYCASLVNAPLILSEKIIGMTGVFYNCTSLITVPSIPSRVANMDATFYGCTSLVTAPIIPDSVTTMESTFRGCTSLVNVPAILKSVTNMNCTFCECLKLEKVLIIGTSTNVKRHSFAFSNTPSTLKIYVPKENLAAWKSITPSDWGLTSTDVFENIAPITKKWKKIA